jgi:hypothetical protein
MASLQEPVYNEPPAADEPEAIFLNLNMLLYVVLFLIILALFLGSLVRSRMGAGRSRRNTSIPEGRCADLEKELEDKGE